jgi:NAD(P)-dependent dehydrogenase (short-subunit alcohol dehydrogenase family)
MTGSQGNARGIAVLSGATRGMGARVTLALAEQGFRTCLLSHNLDEAHRLVETIESRGGSGAVYPCMVEDEAQLRDTYARIRDMFHQNVTVAFTNMGMMPDSPQYPRKDVADITCDEWDAYMDTALKGAFNSTAIALRAMREGEGPGVVVNMARFGLQAGPGLGLYSASRAAILSLTETANAEAARDSLPITSYLVDCESDMYDVEDEVVRLVTDLCTGTYRGGPGLVRV